MGKRLIGWAKRALVILSVVLLTIVAVRIYDIQRGPPLQPWHTYVPQELDAQALDATDWNGYLQAEERIFRDTGDYLRTHLPEEEKVAGNRYFEGSPLHASKFKHDWNRSFVLEPEGEPLGAVVLLHGLTDAPYSLRHVARYYRDHGYVAIGLRVPGHGTVPAGLAAADAGEWMAATRLAVREAERRVGPDRPLHLVGYSNGAALAVKYALDVIEQGQGRQADRIVLISPMVGVSGFARWARLAGLPALLPAFTKAAWLDILPEYNPFKYNSFPVRAARKSHQVSTALQQQVARLARKGQLEAMPPVLTFQSVLDATTQAQAVVDDFYSHLPANGSELVLYDVNRSTKFGLLLRTSAGNAIARQFPTGPQRYRINVVESTADGAAVMRTREPGRRSEQVRALGTNWPGQVYSLSHVALPFPVSDALYGMQPDEDEGFGIHLGEIDPRGERGSLIVGMDTLQRISSNPFFEQMLEKIGEGIDGAASPLQDDGPQPSGEAIPESVAPEASIPAS